MGKEIREYDKDNNLIYYKRDNFKQWFKYDENNNLIFFMDNKDFSLGEYRRYDEKGNQKEITQQEFKQIERTKLYFNIKRSNRSEIMDI